MIIVFALPVAQTVGEGIFFELIEEESGTLPVCANGIDLTGHGSKNKVLKYSLYNVNINVL